MAQVTFLTLGTKYEKVGDDWALFGPGVVYFPANSFPADVACAVAFGVRKGVSEKVTYRVGIADAGGVSVLTKGTKPIAGGMVSYAYGDSEDVFRTTFPRVHTLSLTVPAPGIYLLTLELNEQEAARTEIHVVQAKATE